MILYYHAVHILNVITCWDGKYLQREILLNFRRQIFLWVNVQAELRLGEGAAGETGSQAEKDFCCPNVTETLAVCPAFGTPFHVKNTRGQEEAEEVAARLGSVHWLRQRPG